MDAPTPHVEARQDPEPAAGRPRHVATALLVAFTVGILLVLGTGRANASGDPDSVGKLLKHVQKTAADTVQKRWSASNPSQNAPDPPASDDDSAGHETANPQAPDHGSSELGHAGLAGQELIRVGSGRSRINDDGSTTADSTLLAVGGQEVVGSHATSDGQNQSQGAAPSIPVCEQTSGAVCLDLLYSNSSATQTGSASDSSTQNGVSNVCLGGSDPGADPSTCASPVDIALAYSNSNAHRDRKTGETSATADSQLLAICLRQDPVLGTCTVSADVISSRGAADSDGNTDRRSDVAKLAITPPGTLPTIPGLPTLPVGSGGGVPTSSDPFTFSIPADCASPSLLCVFGNQGETYRGKGVSGTAQQALEIQALNKTLGIDVAQAETLTHEAGAVRAPSTPATSTTAKNTNPPKHTTLTAQLPFTGGAWSGLLAMGLLLFAAGAVATAWDRRRVFA